MSRLFSLYPFPYDSLLFFGWSLCLVRVLSSFVSTKSVAGAYASAGQFVCLLQFVAFVEVVHGALGIVPSGVLFPLMQWGGRSQFLLAIVRRIPEVQELPSVFITFVAWCCSDVIRYAHYTLNILKSCPPWVTYIRYLVYIPFSGLPRSPLIHTVLYPLGIAPGEMWIMFKALPYIKKMKLYGDIFSGLPFGYHEFVSPLSWFHHHFWVRGNNIWSNMSEQKDWKQQRHISRGRLLCMESFSV